MKNKTVLCVLTAAIMLLSGCADIADNMADKAESIADKVDNAVNNIDTTESNTEQVSESSVLTEKEIKETGKTVKSERLMLSLPECWEEKGSNRKMRYFYAETGSTLAMITISNYSDSDPVSLKALHDDEPNMRKMLAVSYNTASDKIECSDLTTDSGITGVVYSFDSDMSDISGNAGQGKCKAFWVPSVEDNHWLAVTAFISDNCNNNYDDEIEKVFASIREYDGTEENTTAAPAKGIRPEFKKAMDAYEEFFDDYIDFMQNYSDSDDALSMLSDYFSYLEKYAESMEELDEIGDEDMSEKELAYYTEVMLRINGKLLNSYT